MALYRTPGYTPVARRYGHISLTASAVGEQPSAKRIARAEKRIAKKIAAECEALGLDVAEVDLQLRLTDEDIPF